MKILTALVLAGALVGGGVVAWKSAPTVGERAARERAAKLFNAMETYPGATAWDQAREGRRYGDVRIVVAKDTEDGREIVLAVRATREQGYGFFADEPYDVTRCFRWTEDRDWDEADQVDCPAPEVDKVSATGDPIPDSADATVTQALRQNDDAARVRAALAGLDAQVAEVAPRPGSGPDPAVAVAVHGLAGWASGRRVNECLFGVREGGTVKVWRPTRIQVAPGEGSCDPESAMSPYMRSAPH